MRTDIIELLTDQGIRYWTSGKNCSEGWVNIQCPYCDDRSNHLGINYRSSAFNCWKCSMSGDLIDLLQQLLGLDFGQVKSLTREYGLENRMVYSPRMEKRRREIRDVIPKEAKEQLPTLHQEYLRMRGFNPRAIQKRYHILGTEEVGKYKWRIIIPVIMNGVTVSFVARAVAGQNPPYKNCRNDQAVMDIKDCMYNIDRCRGETGVVVEGITDVWRLGDKAMAPLGVEYTMEQVRLVAKKCSRVFVIFDSAKKDRNAPKRANDFANQLSGLIDDVNVWELDEGDPGELTWSEALKIRKEIGL